MQSTIKKSGRKNAAVKLDPRKYGRLLARVLPVRIADEEENGRMLREAEKLIAKGDGRTAEEDALLDLMLHLIQDFERRFYQPGDATPHEILKELMAARGVRQSDLWGLFGSKGVASEVVNGKRAISKAQAKALAEFFNVPADLFI